MSKEVRFEFNVSGLNEIMKSGAMQSHLESAGQAVASAAGSDYASSVHQGDFTAIANVWPDSADAARENYESNTLLKALGSVGLHSGKGG